MTRSSEKLTKAPQGIVNAVIPFGFWEMPFHLYQPGMLQTPGGGDAFLRLVLEHGRQE